MLLEEISSPDDVRGLGPEDLNRLAEEIREFLVSAVARTGGHLGPNLGVVELTLALHRVFDSPRDTIVFDTGHQAYVHKMITGRLGLFDTLRQHAVCAASPARSSASSATDRSPAAWRTRRSTTSASSRPTW
jgi:1-deoxy-D-xylulose-5-phosphate synthase